MSEVKKKIKQDLYTLTKENEKLKDDNKSLRLGFKLALAHIAELTGKEKTPFDKYYR